MARPPCTTSCATACSTSGITSRDKRRSANRPGSLPYNFPMTDSGRIAINAAIIGERPTGLGLYALDVIRALDALGERLLVYTSRPDLVTGGRMRVEPVPATLRPERG